MTVASVAPAGQAACQALRDRLITQATQHAQSPLRGLRADDIVPITLDKLL